jgi:tight adherence protein C
VPFISAIRDERRRSAAVVQALPEVVDLLAIAVAAGCNVRLAVDAVACRVTSGPFAQAMAAVRAEVAAGGRLGDALERVRADLGEPVRPLVGALLDAERYGAPLGSALERLALEARVARQRGAEEAARRVPIKMLFPLVTCVLPAFGLLTVAPMIASGLRSLRL